MRKYLGDYYNTKIEAQIALFFWKRKQYKEIEERGDKVLKDTSRVYKKLVWSKPKPINPKEPNGLCSSHETDVMKWFVWHGIWTQGLVDDIANLKPIDVEAELTAILNDPDLQKANEHFIKNIKDKGLDNSKE